MPRLCHVLDPRLALVADQCERQRILVRATERVDTGAFAGFENGSHMAGLLKRDSIACERIIPPDLGLRLHSRDMKRAVGIEGPDRPQRVAPRPCERRRARRSSCA